jgi:predicted RNA methylase
MRVDTAVLNVLDAATKVGNSLVLVGQLDRALYTKTNKVLEACGGKWIKAKKAHIFDGDAAERVEQIILTGEVTIPKDEFDFFPTPPAVVERVIELAQISPLMCVLEPSAGQGALAKAAFNAGALVDMYELMPANNQKLRDLDLSLCNVFDPCDFLTVNPRRAYDRVVMNPPFTKQADIKHVLHALKFVKEGGRLVSVMPSSVVFRNNSLTTFFRDVVAEYGGDIEELPEGSFKSSGTMVNTVIVSIQL